MLKMKAFITVRKNLLCTPPFNSFEKTLYTGGQFWLFLTFPLISTSNLHMGNLKKKRRLKMNNHKRRKRLKSNRHKKRTW